jgi:hypothetical protein
VPTSELHIPVRFDADVFDEDMARATASGKTAAEVARRDYEQAGGIPASHLKPCDAKGRDGTSLPQCVKTYIPQPGGRFGMVFEWVIHPTGPHLRYLAFGVRHHPKGSHALTVYEIAHGRLHEQT